MNIKRVTGKELIPWIPELARLRIEVFRDFPYLYEGSLSYEKKYLQTYVESTQSVIVLALDGNKAVGASTGMPLSDETDEVIKPFKEAGFNIDEVFYFGESVLDNSYRGRGIGFRFFEEREAHAKELGFKTASFCAIERREDHPLKPAGYKNLHGFWRNRGYEIRTDLKTEFSWQDIGEETESKKEMIFWLRNLE